MQQPPSNATAYISLGSNLGDRAGNLLMAIRGMRDAGFNVTRLSQVYETEPVETFPQPLFLNMVAELSIEAAADPEVMMAQLLQLEQALGRTRDGIKGPRTIDLDLLLFGNQTRNSQLLTLPHPRFHLRRFVLAPLVEIASQLVHPTLGKTMNELLEQVEDKSAVHVWHPPFETHSSELKL